MRILLLAVDDWGNTGYMMARALEAAGQSVMAFKKNSHPFGYEHQMTVAREEEVADHWDEADSVVFVHTAPWNIPNVSTEGKHIVVHHGGTAYRQAAATWNAFWNDKVHATLIESPDLLERGAKNEILFPTPVDTDALTPAHRESHRPAPSFGHYPSNASQKGTDTIASALRWLSDVEPRVTWEIGVDRVSHAAQIERMRHCDVVIDQIKAEQNGQVLGEYGIAAREAAALGVLPVSNHRGAALYERFYGPTEVVRADTLVELRQQLLNLARLDRDALEERKCRARWWVQNCHSLKAAGKFLMERVYSS